MFQSFTSTASPQNVAPRLKSLRKQMAREKIDWYLVPHADEHQNEYLPTSAERLAWLTGFTGSAGFAVIGRKRAFLFVDGRYTVQAASQTDTRIIETVDLVSSPPTTFAKIIFKSGNVVGFDPWLLTVSQKAAWMKSVEATRSTLKPFDNLIDRVWQDQPTPPRSKAWLHPTRHAGQKASEKVSQLKSIIAEDGADCLLLTDPASIAWTFNLRGSDLVHNPLALAWALIPAGKSKPRLFIHKEKLDSKDTATLTRLAALVSPDNLEKHLAAKTANKRVHCDPALVASALADTMTASGAQLVKKRDPVVILRAVKNQVELAGAKRAHIRDGVAMVRFLAWLDGEPPGTVDEISAANRLEQLRIETATAIAPEFASPLREISFDTISGAGPNGAYPHYRVSTASNAVLKNDTLYLVDSGGQYIDGTTDITRTIAIGSPPAQARTDFTNVLKGHIAIAMARFPEGTRGVDIDVLARLALWRNGKDYAHGTGHGIGSYLNVHEGPQSISRRSMEIFQPGMIISNEPGYYREGHYGIRIENLVIVEPPRPIKGGDKPMMGFETITLCPIDQRLIDKNLLEKAEITWLNQYHKTVYETLSPHLGAADKKWLKAATKAL